MAYLSAMWYAEVAYKYILHNIMYIYIYTQDGLTPLYIAGREGHGALVKVLLQAEHMDVNIINKVWH